MIRKPNLETGTSRQCMILEAPAEYPPRPCAHDLASRSIHNWTSFPSILGRGSDGAVVGRHDADNFMCIRGRYSAATVFASVAGTCCCKITSKGGSQRAAGRHISGRRRCITPAVSAAVPQTPRREPCVSGAARTKGIRALSTPVHRRRAGHFAYRARLVRPICDMSHHALPQSWCTARCCSLARYLAIDPVPIRRNKYRILPLVLHAHSSFTTPTACLSGPTVSGEIRSRLTSTGLRQPCLHRRLFGTLLLGYRNNRANHSNNSLITIRDRCNKRGR